MYQIENQVQGRIVNVVLKPHKAAALIFYPLILGNFNPFYLPMFSQKQTKHPWEVNRAEENYGKEGSGRNRAYSEYKTIPNR